MNLVPFRDVIRYSRLEICVVLLKPRFQYEILVFNLNACPAVGHNVHTLDDLKQGGICPPPPFEYDPDEIPNNKFLPLMRKLSSQKYIS